MKIIGVDPGSRLTGYGIVEKINSQLVHYDCGVIIPPPKDPLPSRLLYIAQKLETVISEFKPEAAAVEDVFYAKNWRSALKLGQARGVILSTLAKFDFPITTYAPTRVKQSVVGNGRASKDQVQQMVRLLLNLPEIPEENAADALAIAICHVHGTPQGWEDVLK